MNGYIVVTASDNEDDAVAFGPFRNKEAADGFIEAYEEAEVRVAYPLIAVELQGVRAGRREIREAIKEWSEA